MLTNIVSFIFQIVWPEEWSPDHPDFDESAIVVLSVDGILCPAHEFSTTHPTKTKDPLYFSFKHKHSGFLYEIGCSIWTNHCVWIRGPYPGGQTNDKGMFNDALKDKIPPGKKALGDSIYRGDQDICISKNKQDTPEVRKFKRRALARHEAFNGRLKRYDCLSNNFRHSMAKHKISFEAVAVICQYQIENECPMFDV